MLQISRIKVERDTLKKVHEQLVKLLSEQYKERDEFLEELLQNSEESMRALLLQEVLFRISVHMIFITFYVFSRFEERTNCSTKTLCCNRKYCYYALGVKHYLINKKHASFH